jgi:lipoyl-dependent peroxiredoxin
MATSALCIDIQDGVDDEQHRAALHGALKGSAMIETTASVSWEGPGKKGEGQIITETGALKRYPNGFASRFEDDRRAINARENLAAAHAACFTMAFSFACDKGGFANDKVDTQVHVRLSPQGEGFVIDRIALTLNAAVPGIDEARFTAFGTSSDRGQELALTGNHRYGFSTMNGASNEDSNENVDRPGDKVLAIDG